ncbi:autophagy- protein 2 [Puccinia graminis f. sp. tritici]|uniref:Autophagy-related protein 2 n=1 Tax=Puccinia graminis f. sp. tritici TaxID=56615 RepID=A0A5B0RUU5_PUCGR|nr:autophagy- protein 2 [Puccinia graminis f. sp. tritici]
MVPFSLPSFAPSNLQHNLLSYLVRRFLGPLLKHGAQSLDHQLNTPNQPGTFNLKDVQLEPKALQGHLSGSLSPFTIQAVCVSELSLQINWPSWSFSLQGYVPDVKVTLKDIQLTLGLTEEHQANHQSSSHLLNSINLDENLATIANDFVSQEWSDSHEDQLEQDFPGAFTTGKTNQSSTSAIADQDQRGFFAGLVQKILAKFNFELNHLTVLLHHQDVQVLLSIDHIKSLDLTSDDDPHPSSSISREIRTSCPVIYLKPLSDQAQADPSPSPNSSSNQSFDSEHDMLMSQATVDLRRPAPLFVSVAETLDPIDQQQNSPENTPQSSQSIIKSENILAEFIGTSPTNESKLSPEPPISPEGNSPEEEEGTKESLDPKNSLRFLFWLVNSTSSNSTEESKPDSIKPDSTGLPSQDPTPQSNIQRSQLNIQIHLPILAVSIRLPHHLNALTRIISTIPLTSNSSQANHPTPTLEATSSLAISATLRLQELNCTLAFPTPYHQSTTGHEQLSSLSVQATVIKLGYQNTSSVRPGSDEKQPTSEVTIRVDQVQGRSEILHTPSSPPTRLHSAFLLAPARDDHPSPAVSISQTVETLQILFSSIWVNLDLEVVAILIPVFEAVQASFIANCPDSNESFDDEERGDPSTGPHSHEQGVSSRLKENQHKQTTTTVSIPSLYMDIKAPTHRAPSTSRRPPELVLGSVLKSVQMILTSERQIGGSVFEVALGFRVAKTKDARLHPALEPFLGIAHPTIPASLDQQHRFPGLRLTHILPPPSPLKFGHPPTLRKPSSLKLENVTIDLSKDQFDRLQYWIDDLGRWANDLFAPSSSSSLLLDPPPPARPNHKLAKEAVSKPRQERQKTKDRNDNNGHKDQEEGGENVLGTLMVSKIALTIRLPSDNLDSTQRKQQKQQHQEQPLKLLIQLDSLSILQSRLSVNKKGPFDSQIRLLIRACSASLLPSSQPPSSSTSSSATTAANANATAAAAAPAPGLSILYQSFPNLPRSSDVSAVSMIILTSQPQNNSRKNNGEDDQSEVKKMDVHLKVLHSTVRLGPCCVWTSQLARFLKAPVGVSFAPLIELNDLRISSVDQVKVSPSVRRVEDPIVASTMLRSAMRESSSASRSILIQKDEDLAEEDYPTDVAFLGQTRPASSHRHHHHHHHHPLVNQSAPAILRPLAGQGLNIIDDYLLKTPTASKVSRQPIETEVQVEHLDVLVRFYDGYDWNSTRQTIQQAQKTVRKRLQKIRQLLATGNPADARSMEEDLGPTTLFKSVQLGLDSSTRGLSTAQLLDAIDDQLEKEPAEPVGDEAESMTGSWQSLAAHPSKDLPHPRLVSVPSSKQRHLGRSAQPMLKIVLNGIQGHFRKYQETAPQADQNRKNDRSNNECRLSSLQLKTDALTIIDNIPTSTWKKFLTELRPGEGGLMRPTDAPMLRLKFLITPSAKDSRLKEAIIKLKISPLRLYVDQDAVDFLKTFFAFQKQSSSSSASGSSPPISSASDPPAPSPDGLFFQRVEILPIRIKLDYKPKRVNYMALKEGKTIELMNFFHFEGSDMVLRHATLTGISKASKIGEMLQEIWTPDVKANQLADVISGIAPVRSVVNLGTGIADLVLLPIEEMKKKDGRLSRGLQKGTSSFAKNTTLEMIKLGARLAIGTQVILEKAESMLGAKLTNDQLCGETIDHLHHLTTPNPNDQSLDHNTNSPHLLLQDHEHFSKYALQPSDFKSGAQSAYHDLRDNFRSTAQTILAVPLEVFNEGSGQAVVKAIPIAILHPMVGATGAISKTLLGLHNSLDPLGSTSHLLDKYKQQQHHPSSSSPSSSSNSHALHDPAGRHHHHSPSSS